MGTFRFKQFEVVQDFAAMKVNTDAVLLGAWMSLPKEVCTPAQIRMLDIGTGTGVIALMAAQRLADTGLCGTVEAVEIDTDACKDAERNFGAAPWEGVNMVLHKKSLQELSDSLPDKYNLIFTNPPYFIDSLKSSDDAKCLARHTDSLSQREILFHCAKMLAPGGRLALVLPVTEGEEFLRKVEFLRNHTPQGENCFHPHRICRVHTVGRKPAKRMLIELVFCSTAANITAGAERLVMLNNGSFTDQYAELVGSFYL